MMNEYDSWNDDGDTEGEEGEVSVFLIADIEECRQQGLRIISEDDILSLEELQGGEE